MGFWGAAGDGLAAVLGAGFSVAVGFDEMEVLV